MKKVKSIKEKFIKKFGVELANKIEEAADTHSNDLFFNMENKGSDPFKWALIVCISNQCLEEDEFRKFHNIPLKPSWDEIKNWLKKHGELGDYDGDIDFLSLFCGVYNEFVISDKPKKTRSLKRSIK